MLIADYMVIPMPAAKVKSSAKVQRLFRYDQN